jgi:dTDP-4-dehydrorhamnose reductase
MLKVAITGSTGLIGSRMVELLKDKISFIPLTQADMNITDMSSVEKAISGLHFDLFLHLAGYTNVDQAEKTPGPAIALNVDGTRNVFNAVDAKNKKFVYISTDFVFDGQSPPYHEFFG